MIGNLYTRDGEIGVLGACFLSPAVFPALRLASQDFQIPSHQAIWDAMTTTAAGGATIGIAPVFDELERVGLANAVGGRRYLEDLQDSVFTADNVEYFADRVREHSVMRQTVAVLGALLTQVKRRGESGDDLLESAQAALANLRAAKIPAARRIGEIAAGVVREVLANEDRRARGEAAVGGIPSGLRSLDAHIDGHPTGLVSLVIGRPGMGKSTYALGALESASAAGIAGLLVSYEDPDRVTAARGIALRGGVATHRLRAGGLDRAEMAAMVDGANQLRSSCWWVLPAAGKSTEEITRAVRRFVREHCVRHVHIDYLQLMDWPRGAKDENDGLGRNLKALSVLAATEQIAVIVYSQLSRENLKRENKRPTLGDVRGSGVGEQVAKLVLGLHYEPAYTAWAQLPVADRNRYTGEDEWRASLEILVLKDVAGEARHRVIVEWDRPHARLADRRAAASNTQGDLP